MKKALKYLWLSMLQGRFPLRHALQLWAISFLTVRERWELSEKAFGNRDTIQNFCTDVERAAWDL